MVMSRTIWSFTFDAPRLVGEYGHLPANTITRLEVKAIEFQAMPSAEMIARVAVRRARHYLGNRPIIVRRVDRYEF